MSRSRSSSPDPLQDLDAPTVNDGPLRRSRSPSKRLFTPTRALLPPRNYSTSKVNILSPTKMTATSNAVLSPWRFKVVVQAERDAEGEGSPSRGGREAMRGNRGRAIGSTPPPAFMLDLDTGNGERHEVELPPFRTQRRRLQPDSIRTTTKTTKVPLKGLNSSPAGRVGNRVAKGTPARRTTPATTKTTKVPLKGMGSSPVRRVVKRTATAEDTSIGRTPRKGVVKAAVTPRRERTIPPPNIEEEEEEEGEDTLVPEDEDRAEDMVLDTPIKPTPSTPKTPQTRRKAPATTPLRPTIAATRTRRLTPAINYYEEDSNTNTSFREASTGNRQLPTRTPQYARGRGGAMLPSTTPRPMYPDHPNLNDLTSPVPMNGQETPAASRRLLNNRTPAAGRITTTPSISPPNQLPGFTPAGFPGLPESNLNTPAFHSSLFPSSLGGGMDLDLNSADDWGDGGGGMEDIPEEEAFRGLGLSSVAGTNDVRSVDSSVGMRGSSIIDSPDSQGRKGSSIGVASDGGLRSDIRDMQDMDFSYIAPNTSNRTQGKAVGNKPEPMVLGSDYVGFDGGVESDSGEDEGEDEGADEGSVNQLSAVNEEEEDDDDDVDMISIAPSIISTTRSPSRIAESMTPQPRRLIDPSSMGPQLSEVDTPQTRRFNSQFFSQPGTPVVMGQGVIRAGTAGTVGSVDGTDEDEDGGDEVDAMVMASSPPVFRNAAGRVVQRPVPMPMSPDTEEEGEEDTELAEGNEEEEEEEDEVTPIPTFASSPPILRRSQQAQPSQSQNISTPSQTPQAPLPKRTQPFEVVIYTPAKPAKTTQSTAPKSTKPTKLPPPSTKLEEEEEGENEEDNEEVRVDQRPFSNLVPGQVWDAPASASKIQAPRAPRASTLEAFSASIQASQASALGAPPSQSSTSQAQFITPNQPTDQEMPDAPQSNPINRDTPRLGKVRERSEVMSDALDVDDEMMMRGEEFGGESAGNSFQSAVSRTQMTIITPRESFAEAVTGRLQQTQEEEAEEPVLPAPAPRLSGSEIQEGRANASQAHQENDFEEISSFQFAPEAQAHQQDNDFEEISSFQFAPEESPDEEFISSFRYADGHPSSSGPTAAAVAAAKTPTPSPPPPQPQSRAATYLSRILSPFKRTPAKPPPGAPTPKRAFTSFTNSTTPTKPPPTPRRAFGTSVPLGTARSVRFAVPSSSANTSISSIGNATLAAANMSTISSIGNETMVAAHEAAEAGNVSYPNLNTTTGLNQPSYPDLNSLSTSYAHERAQNIARAREVGAITIDSIDSSNAAISAPSTIRTLRQLEGVWEMERQHVRNEAGSKAIKINDEGEDEDMENGDELDGQDASLAGDTTHFERQLATHLETERAEQEERERQEQEQRLRERKREDSVMSSITTWTGSSSESHITSSRSSPPVEADASASSATALQIAGNLETAEAEAQAEVQATTQRALEVVREVEEDMEMEDTASAEAMEAMEEDEPTREPTPQPTPGLRFKPRPLCAPRAPRAPRASSRIRRFAPRAASSTPKKLTPVVEVPVRSPTVAESADNSAIVIDSTDNSAIVIPSADNSAIVIPSGDNTENSAILIPDDNDDEAPIPEVEADTHEAAEADDILSSLAFGSSSSSSLPWTRENYRHLSAVLKSSSTNPRAAKKQYSVQIIRSAANRLLAREVVESLRLDGEGMMLLSLKDSAGVERFVRREGLRNRKWDTREVVRRAAGLRIAEVRRRVRGKGVERG